MKVIYFYLGMAVFLGFSGRTWAIDGAGANALSGHVKYRVNYQSFPADSLYRETLGSAALDQYLETRLKFAASRERWDIKADYQFIGIHADSLPLATGLTGSSMPVDRVISDDRRWWDLTYRSDHGQRSAVVHRLDRLNVGYTTQRSVWRFGRQAISWGNGMIFTPMDVFNPFDPAAVDKEYKTGDDMLYGQYLLRGGADLQGVAVVRRDPVSGKVESDQSSAALKYHGFLARGEFDLLAADHYGDMILGLGGNVGLGGAILRGDLTWTSTDRDETFAAVTSLSYSWTWGGRNVSGVLEYYYNGFGQAESAYSPADLAANPELLVRLQRGELYTLARNYLGASVTLELTPLVLLVPALFINLDDPSALVQVALQYGLSQDVDLLCAINLPLGPNGTEYGGIPAPVEGYYLSTDAGLFAQLAWYF
jgi:hypothetical protein